MAPLHPSRKRTAQQYASDEDYDSPRPGEDDLTEDIEFDEPMSGTENGSNYESSSEQRSGQSTPTHRGGPLETTDFAQNTARRTRRQQKAPVVPAVPSPQALGRPSQPTSTQNPLGQPIPGRPEPLQEPTPAPAQPDPAVVDAGPG